MTKKQLWSLVGACLFAFVLFACVTIVLLDKFRQQASPQIIVKKEESEPLPVEHVTPGELSRRFYENEVAAERDFVQSVVHGHVSRVSKGCVHFSPNVRCYSYDDLSQLRSGTAVSIFGTWPKIVDGNVSIKSCKIISIGDDKTVKAVKLREMLLNASNSRKRNK